VLDPNNPEIRVDEIMQRIQEKVRTRRQSSLRTSDDISIVAVDPGLPGSTAVEEVFARAHQVADAGAAVPPMTRLRGPMRVLAAGLAKIFLRTAQIITRDQRAFNHAALDLVRTLANELARARSEAIALRRDSAGLRTELNAVRTELTAVRMELSQAQTRIGELQTKAEETKPAIAQLRTSVSLQERRLISLVTGGTDHVQGNGGRPIPDEPPNVLDSTYLGFEDEFRGAREEIKERLSVYLPMLRAAQAATGNGRVLDVGCGRGELLELLRAEGLAASGVDSNHSAAEQCRELGLDVVLGDAFETLRETPDGSIGALTAIHVIEHVPYALLLRLIDESLRVLRPGGVAIFETPNPNNVLVGSCNFYVDPTHRNPVHPRMLQYLFEARGMLRVGTMPLHPYPAAMHVPEGDSLLARRFNEYFYGPQDYAVLGYRP
jgi:SAM-dependent methyltransferase